MEKQNLCCRFQDCLAMVSMVRRQVNWNCSRESLERMQATEGQNLRRRFQD